MRRPLVPALLLALAVPSAQAFDPFEVEEIRVDGLQRIAEGTVFNYLPLEVGEVMDQERASESIRSLYETGFFRDIELQQENGVLVVSVAERPAVARIEIRGNDEIRSDDIIDALASVGLAEGQVFDRFRLADIERELRELYFSRGKYDVSVESTISPLERNRVAVRLDIDEGPIAAIREIHFVGNEAFSERQLRREMELRPRRWWHFFSDRHRYSRDRLGNDLENLRSYYMDRGYINFTVTSTQVSITPDREDVHVTVNLSEGQQYTIGQQRIAGDLIVDREELEGLLELESGDTYSRSEAQAASRAMQDRLGQEGYAFSNVTIRPEVDEDTGVVDLTYMVDPGRRVYVRRINISGNERTQDEVVRRELRQLEGSALNTADLRESQRQLDRTGFFDRVNIETPQVPGSDDEVDVDVTVDERLSGSLTAGIGYGESQGLLLNLGVAQDNVLGTGDRMSLELNNSRVNTVYSASYTDRYYTLDGVSRRFFGSYRETRARRADLSDYDLTAIRGGAGLGIPITNNDRISLDLAYENIEIDERDNTPERITSFIENEGNRFDMLKLEAAWTRDTRDRAIFPREGARQRLSGEVSVPGMDLTFFKTSYSHRRFWPLSENLTFSVDGSISYGDSYGDTSRLPFFEHYYAGGVSTVRGYRSNFLGPRSEENGNDRPRGGNVRLLGSAEVLFPPPFTEAESVRMSVFVDAGQVYQTRGDIYGGESDVYPDNLDSVNLNELRAAAGVGLTWMSPIGALTFSIAEPLNDTNDDDTETFQFSLGTSF
ncbi:Beta-barrel assembly machine subunit BamA [Alkalispirillum mobile]|uniref:Outer membrane protein assembly factor BamA n=1 Tax=Alkalispirillum mobile TaxID=85925 RepID=A0A498CE50_9GAMM|nr:outer membrane protein assembly factor BamA [Alkalispirillum mobile]RLK50718.1 Beta-barrel assembly machine subunit BamA [Alkalispirillum mobile]